MTAAEATTSRTIGPLPKIDGPYWMISSQNLTVLWESSLYEAGANTAILKPAGSDYITWVGDFMPQRGVYGKRYYFNTPGTRKLFFSSTVFYNASYSVTFSWESNLHVSGFRHNISRLTRIVDLAEPFEQQQPVHPYLSYLWLPGDIRAPNLRFTDPNPTYAYRGTTIKAGGTIELRLKMLYSVRSVVSQTRTIYVAGFPTKMVATTRDVCTASAGNDPQTTTPFLCQWSSQPASMTLTAGIPGFDTTLTTVYFTAADTILSYWVSGAPHTALPAARSTSTLNGVPAVAISSLYLAATPPAADILHYNLPGTYKLALNVTRVFENGTRK